MISRQGTWAEVTDGSYVRDLSGKVWRAGPRDWEGGISLTDQNATTVRIPAPPADHPVTLLEPSHDEAVALVERELGAQHIVTEEPRRPPRCDPFPNRVGPAAHSHMILMHGMWTQDVKTIAGLREAHDDGHETQERPYYVPHEHRERS